jgi:hypothetical protein
VTTSGINFVPSVISIEVGQTVCFTPGSFHNVQNVADASTCDNMTTTPLFIGVQLGEPVQHTFSQVGSFHFKCNPHCMLGMRGVVQVVAASTTTPAVTTAATTPLVCPNNCGQPENGGGTCDVRPSDGAIRCQSCNADKILLKGRCNVAITCRGNVIQSGRLVNQSCRCLDNDCFNCQRSAIEDTCIRCRAQKYLLNASCNAACPSHLTHSGNGDFGRRCLDPFMCKGNGIGQMVGDAFVHSGLNFGCKCTDDNCYQCDHPAGGFGSTCLRCRANKFRLNGACLDDCSTAPASFIEYFPGSYGRECRLPFVCQNNLDEQNVSCKCHGSVRTNGVRCRHCSYNSTGVTCLE